MNDVIVAARGLGKGYRVYSKPWDRLLEALSRRPRHRQFQALQGVDFELLRGEGLAVVGENGAGKSTLLKILAGVTAPSCGKFEVHGTVASILELGSGFHPDLTGRQNIGLNAAMLGLTPAMIREKTPAIIEFSELGQFIEQPVKTYSTGMTMRLGFAIATQVEPDVLIIDEALSVGDGYFQKKCMDRLQHFVAGGGTLLFCSHAMYFVSAFCQRAIWLRGGQVEALGPVDEVVRRYENFLLQKSAAEAQPEAPPEIGPARFSRVELARGRRAAEPAAFHHQDPWLLDLEWEAESPQTAFHLGVGIDRVDGVQVASFSTRREELPPYQGQRSYRVRLELPRLPLIKGEFSVYAFLLDEAALHTYDRKVLQRCFVLEGDRYEIGLIKIAHRWRELHEEDAAAAEPTEPAATFDAPAIAGVLDNPSGAR